jgi:hypothetical protein
MDPSELASHRFLIRNRTRTSIHKRRMRPSLNGTGMKMKRKGTIEIKMKRTSKIAAN